MFGVYSCNFCVFSNLGFQIWGPRLMTMVMVMVMVIATVMVEMLQ